MISAKIIADSISPSGCRLTSFLLVFPRIVLAEFNTHRMISKNSASSRAIPFQKMLAQVKENPFIPLAFQKDHKGMQGSSYLEGDEAEEAKLEWLDARDAAVEAATRVHEVGVTKQLCNRLLEPFLYHTVIATGTDWQNFFALRANDDAEIHIQDLAYKMLEAYNESTPKSLNINEWHIPFGDSFDFKRLMELNPANSMEYEQIKVRIATARCARVSYLNFEGKDDYAEDLKLYERLSTSGHWSPFEHCAVASQPLRYGNFHGFIQLRKMAHGDVENKRDHRVMDKEWNRSSHEESEEEALQ